jgi:small subunit ribosomal protein S14
MTKHIEKDKKKRFLFLKYEKDRKVLKSICKNTNLSSYLRHKASLSLSDLPKDSSKVRLKNRCTLTGRSRFILRSFNLSRLMFRKLVRDGLIPGLTKSSW